MAVAKAVQLLEFGALIRPSHQIMNCPGGDVVVSNVSDDLPDKVGHKGLPAGAIWLTIAARSFAFAVAAGAGQLGAAQALAMLEWDPVPTPDIWQRQLTWLAFIGAASVFVGVAGSRRQVRAVRHAIAGHRVLAADRRSATPVPESSRRRLVLSMRYHAVDAAARLLAGASRVNAAAAASMGTAASFPLVWVPTREVLDVDELSSLVMAFGAGIAVGALVSVLSLAVAPIATNTAVWLGGAWILGLGSVATMLDAEQPWRTPLLGALDAPGLVGPQDWWLGPYVIVVVAVLFAGAVAASARWSGEHRLAIAVSGVAGPGIVAASYVFAGPGADLRLHHEVALMATGAGLLVSVVVAVLPHRRQSKEAPVPVATLEAAGTQPQEHTGTPETPASPPEKRPVPVRSSISNSMISVPAAQVAIGATLDAAPIPPMPRKPIPAASPEPPTPVEPLTPVGPLTSVEPLTPVEAATKVGAPAPATGEQPPRRVRRGDRVTKRLARGEREHVDWLEHMMNLPTDPALLTREK